MFHVLENGHPCQLGSWTQYKYENLNDAAEYLHNWLGFWSPGKDALLNLAVNTPYDYDEYGNTVQILSQEIEMSDRFKLYKEGLDVGIALGVAICVLDLDHLNILKDDKGEISLDDIVSRAQSYSNLVARAAVTGKPSDFDSIIEKYKQKKAD